MKPLAQAVLATSIAFSAANGEAAQNLNIYTLNTAKAKADHVIKTFTRQDAFKIASEILAAKIKDHTIDINFKSGNFAWDLARIKNADGHEIGTCRLIGQKGDDFIQSLIDTAEMSEAKSPLEYQIYCGNGAPRPFEIGEETKFTYTPK